MTGNGADANPEMKACRYSLSDTSSSVPERWQFTDAKLGAFKLVIGSATHCIAVLQRAIALYCFVGMAEGRLLRVAPVTEVLLTGAR